MRLITVKQAEKWLKEIKNLDPSKFQQINACLRQFEATNDFYRCFIALNTSLLDYPQITKELNNYLQELNQMIVNRPQKQQFKQFLLSVKAIDPVAFEQIVSRLKEEGQSQGMLQETNEQKNKRIKQYVLERLRGYPDLQDLAAKTIYYSAQDKINNLDLSHLNQPTHTPSQSQKAQSELIAQPKKTSRKISKKQQKIQKKIITEPAYHIPLNDINDEKTFFKYIKDNSLPENYEQFVKLIEIYHLGIITIQQILSSIQPYLGVQEFQAFKKIFNSRQTDRKKKCTSFKPLYDIDFSNAQRATNSYVNMPESYAKFCSGQNQLTKQVLNRKLVSIPHCPQDQFLLRNRNPNETMIFNMQDKMHEMDIEIKKVKVCITTIEKMEQILKNNPDMNVKAYTKKLISLGVSQYLKISHNKLRKRQFQEILTEKPKQIIEDVLNQLKSKLAELQRKKNFQARFWKQVYAKNSVGALDFKRHQFKRLQRQEMKDSVFIRELKFKKQYLMDRGIGPIYDSPFQQQKQFFSILNSFQLSSRNQKCQSRLVDRPIKYNLHQCNDISKLPVLILAFEDKMMLHKTMSCVLFYIQNVLTNQVQKARCNYTFRMVLKIIFRMQRAYMEKLNREKFRQEQFFRKIGKPGYQAQRFKQTVEGYDWFTIQEDEQDIYVQLQDLDILNLDFEREVISEYKYLPLKDRQNIVFYGSQNFYVLLRFMYTIYERLIRMLQVSDGDCENVHLFFALYCNCIKNRQGLKFQDCLNCIFGQNAYIFANFYKIMQGLVKSISTLSSCKLTNFSIKIFDYVINQDIYFLLINKFHVQNNLSNLNILRFTYYPDTNQLLYINLFECFYKTEEYRKSKKRMPHNRKVEAYVNQPVKQYPSQSYPVDRVHIKNEIEYNLQGKINMLQNIGQKEDILVNQDFSKQDMARQNVQKQIQRLKRMHRFMN